MRERALALARFPDEPLLVVGEAGTGRRAIARLIHSASVRRHGTIVEFDATGLPGPVVRSELFGHIRGAFRGAYRDKHGLVWRAQGGCVITAELDDWTAEGRAAIVEFLRTRVAQTIGAEAASPVDVRLIVTVKAHDPIDDAIRLEPLTVPALRDRRDDIDALVEQVMRLAQPDRVPTIAADAQALLREHDWPGNFPELRGVALRLARLGTETITAAAVKKALQANPGAGSTPAGPPS